MPKNKKMAIIPARSLVYISAGEWSDYRVEGLFQAKVDIDPEALCEEWRQSDNNPERAEWESESRIIAWLIGKDLIESLDSFEWHLMDYNDVVEMWVADSKEPRNV